MDKDLFGSDLWQPALDKYAEVTGLTVKLFDVEGRPALEAGHPTPLVALFRECGYEPGLFAKCAQHCVRETSARPSVTVCAVQGLTVVGTPLVLEGAIVGAAVAGYAFAESIQIAEARRWANSAGVPFDSLWSTTRRQAPVPEQRLKLHGELLQLLGEALLRENYRTRQYEDALLQLKGAAANDQFLVVLSHDLRAALAPIAGWAGVIKKSENLEHVRRAAEAIERNALIQARMVDDLLDLSRVVRGNFKLDFEPQELTAVLREALDTSAKEIERKSIRLETFPDPGERLLVEGDAGRLQQVFKNILSNAAKFTPAGGNICVTLEREGRSARIVVADTGVGIAPEYLPFVFEMFRHQESGARRKHPGLGIGLAVVKRLTELHRGTVSVESGGTGRGVEVTVRLPLAERTPELLDAATAGVEPSSAALNQGCRQQRRRTLEAPDET